MRNMEEYELLDKSGEKIVEIVVFSDGKCVAKWVNSEISSVIVYDSLTDFCAVSLNNERKLFSIEPDSYGDINLGNTFDVTNIYNRRHSI